MTNKEWLDYLAHNAPDELAAWFDAEHVETEERALDGDTEPENEDSRERLEAEIESYSAFDMMDTITLDMVIGWLDRQAAITEREYGERMASEAMCSNVCAVVCEQRGRIAELQAKVDELQELNEYHALQYELASEDADILQEQVDRLTAERDNWKANCEDWKKDCERYRDKFGKCLDYADAIHDLMDEGMA